MFCVLQSIQYVKAHFSSFFSIYINFLYRNIANELKNKRTKAVSKSQNRKMLKYRQKVI